MNASSSILSFLILLVAINAIRVGKRQAGDNSYGDEPSLPTQLPYDLIETTFGPQVEQGAEAVNNESPRKHAIVVESGYRRRRQISGYTKGDKHYIKKRSTNGNSEAKTEDKLYGKYSSVKRFS